MIKQLFFILFVAIAITGCKKIVAIPDNEAPPIDTTNTQPIDTTNVIKPIKDTVEVVKLTLRDSLEIKLRSQLNVRETSPNRGPMIDMYLKSVKTQLGVAWCGAFVGYNLSYFKIINPNSAWSPDYAKSKDIIWRPKLKTNIDLLIGDVITIYYKNLKRVGHTGFYIKTDKDGYFITIEGNTNGSGSREGDGVYLKKRDPDKLYAITRYIK